MGLDMYLYAEQDVYSKNLTRTPNEGPALVDNPEYGALLGTIPLSGLVTPMSIAHATIKLQVAYWRKVNQVHAWFVKNCANDVDDCKPVKVSLDDLRRLLDACREVVASPEKADELLPSQEGFFFGSTDYDDWYHEDVLNTANTLSRIIGEAEKVEEADLMCPITFWYQASW